MTPPAVFGKVIERKMLTDDVLFLKLKVPKTFVFQAGQFVSLKVIDDTITPPITKLKSYSIFNPPSEKGIINLGIKLINGGFASEVFRRTKVGDTFELKGPFGHFIFDENNSAAEHWFLGAGTGVAPLYSMIAEHTEKFPQKKFVLLFGARTTRSLFYDAMFKELEKRQTNFKYFPVLSREEWAGKRGHVQEHLPADAQNKTFYICGLKELVLETKELLMKKSVSLENIKFERYD